MSDMSNPPIPDAPLRLREVRAATGLGKTTIYRRIALGEFPRAEIDLGGGIVAWERQAIVDWLKNRPRRPPPAT